VFYNSQHKALNNDFCKYVRTINDKIYLSTAYINYCLHPQEHYRHKNNYFIITNILFYIAHYDNANSDYFRKIPYNNMY
jgi:hypothetical protein